MSLAHVAEMAIAKFNNLSEYLSSHPSLDTIVLQAMKSRKQTRAEANLGDAFQSQCCVINQLTKHSEVIKLSFLP